MALRINQEKTKDVNVQKENVVAEKEKAKAAVQAAMTVEETNKEEYGVDSDKIAFVAALGDPSRDDVTPKIVDGKSVNVTTQTIVGYAFKVLEDMEVPDCGTPSDLKANPMDYVDPHGTRLAKAGETVYLTRFETGALLSPPRFNAKATGGEMHVVATYVYDKKMAADGSTSKATKTFPRVALKALGGGSIKDVKMIDVLSFTVEKQTAGGTIKNKTINPGFEKFISLTKRAQRAGTGRAPAGAPAVMRSKGAEAFMQILEAKDKKGQ